MIKLVVQRSYKQGTAICERNRIWGVASWFVKDQKNKNRGEKNSTRRSKNYRFAFNMLIVSLLSLHTLLHLVALAPMKVWLLSN